MAWHIPMGSRVFGQCLKRGFNGIYQNEQKHCHRYVNEFTFRLNEGNCEIDTEDRLDSLFRAMTGKTITYDELTAND